MVLFKGLAYFLCGQIGLFLQLSLMELDKIL